IVPENVHVYESAPPSPRKKSLLALPPPPPSSEDSDIVSLGVLKNVPMAPLSAECPNDLEMKSPLADEEPVNPISQSLSNNSVPTTSTPAEPDEGTPEYIRRRYFPTAPPDNPDIAWMVSSSQDDSGLDENQLRFDLNGHPISSFKSLSLPTHLGLHHHAEGKRAGYTLDDIFLLIVWWRNTTQSIDTCPTCVTAQSPPAYVSLR
ncbi:hypothetical protein MPER_01145, partial [Moniliophthora perniciosa FA553]